MRTLRKLRSCLGETWIIPLGIAALAVAGLLIRAAAPGIWEDVGGFLLLAGVVVLLLVST